MKKSIHLLIMFGLVYFNVSFGAANTAVESSITSGDNLLDEANGWYVGAGVNHDATYSWDGTRTVDNSTYTFDYDSQNDQDYGYTLLIGKRANNWFSVEFDFMNIGDLSITDSSNTITTTMDEAYAGTLVGIAQYSLLSFIDIYAKGGIAYFSADYSDGVLSEDDRFLALAYGLGIQMNYKQFGVRIDYTCIDQNSSSTSDPIDSGYIPELIGVNLIYYP